MSRVRVAEMTAKNRPKTTTNSLLLPYICGSDQRIVRQDVHHVIVDVVRRRLLESDGGPSHPDVALLIDEATVCY